MLKLRIIAAVVLLFGVFYIFRLIRKRKLELKYALPWLVAILIAAVVDAFPVILVSFTKLLGIQTPSNALFFIVTCLMVCLLFILTVVISRQAERIKSMAQSVAILEERVRRMDKEAAKDESRE